MISVPKQLSLSISFTIVIFVIARVECDRRVFGGIGVPIASYPYQVQIVRYKPGKKELPSSCGGSIIGEDVVLTAGHCFLKGKFKPRQYLIRSGSTFRNGHGGTTHNVVHIYPHDTYDSGRRVHSSNDIALAWVDPPFQFGNNVMQIPVAKTAAKDGDIAVSTGWGMMDKKGKTRAKVLQAVSLRVIDRNKCNGQTEWKGNIASNNFCAGVRGNAASCKGDSGGPLVSGGRLVGLVSWGASPGCIQRGKPSVYTNVTYYADWIMANTDGHGVRFA